MLPNCDTYVSCDNRDYLNVFQEKHMAEPTIICPKCKAEIKLTESLAAPLIESIRCEYEERLSKKDTDIAKREASLREREEALSKAKGHW